MKRLVLDLIHQKGLSAFTSVKPSTSLFEALSVLDSNKCSALLVIENGRLQGIFSEKDFTKASLVKNIHLSAEVGSFMTSKVYYVEPTFNLEECLQLMSKVHVRHLPVLENGRPIALVSMRHIMEVLINDKEAQIRELTTYITGTSLADTEQSQKMQNKVPIYYTNSNQEAL